MIPADDHYSISGDVTNFRDGGNVIDDKWTVELMKARFGTDTTTYTSDSPVFNGKRRVKENGKANSLAPL